MLPVRVSGKEPNSPLSARSRQLHTNLISSIHIQAVEVAVAVAAVVAAAVAAAVAAVRTIYQREMCIYV